jgi:hypothetical protein
MIGDLLPTLARAQSESIQQLQRSIQSGVVPAYIGVPLLQKKLSERQQAQALLLGQQQQGQPPIAEQVMQQANQVTQPQQAQQAPQMPQMPPQQMAQAPQGIDAAPSNMPIEYAGGGIVAFADNEDQPVSSYMPSTRQYDDSYVPSDREGMQKTGFLDWLIPKYEKPEDMSEEEYEKSKRPAYTAPKAGPLTPPAAAAPGSRRETAPAPGTGSVAPPVVEKKPEETKKEPFKPNIERGPSKPAGPGPSQIPGAPPSDGIADFMKKRETSDENLKKLILGDAQDRDKQLQIQTLLKIMKGGLKTYGGTSPYANVNVGAGAEEAVGGIGELYAQQEANKEKRVGQLVALGLKGQELDAELVKLGITRDYYDKHAKLFEAQADYFRRRPTTTGSAGLGYVGQAQSKELMQEYLGYMARPQSAPFFAQLPKDVQRYLKADPSSPSYANAMGEFDRYAKAYRDRQADFIRQNSAKFQQPPYNTEP